MVSVVWLGVAISLCQFAECHYVKCLYSDCCFVLSVMEFHFFVSDPQMKQLCLVNQVYSMILSHKIVRVFM